MSQYVVISLDAMGGDFGVPVVTRAAVEALKGSESLAIILVGDSAAIGKELSELKVSLSDRLQIQHASQAVAMDEPPVQALRTKRDSSMRVALNLVHQGRAAACVSAGNTGALMVTAKHALKMLPGIDRPAIMTALPSMRGHTNMLDLGANVDGTAENLFQFAVMGAAFTSAVDDVPRPRVGLLNVGQEAIKGNEQVKEANLLLAASGLNYIGYVEGDDIYCGDVDVVVCDGFVGNVSLKTTEGAVKMMRHYINLEFRHSIWTKLAALVAMPVLKSFGRRLDPRRYNGASLLGLQGIVIKSHGKADVFSFANAIHVAEREARKDVPRRIEKELAELLRQRCAS